MATEFCGLKMQIFVNRLQRARFWKQSRYRVRVNIQKHEFVKTMMSCACVLRVRSIGIHSSTSNQHTRHSKLQCRTSGQCLCYSRFWVYWRMVLLGALRSWWHSPEIIQVHKLPRELICIGADYFCFLSCSKAHLAKFICKICESVLLH